MSEPADIEIRNVWKEYGSHVVLEHINLSVNAGSFVAIVGASGCGKSTLLRILLGQETLTRGEVSIGGKALAPFPTLERGVVFQRYSVFPHLTVFDNVLLALELRAARWSGRLFGRARRRAAESVKAMLTAVSLEVHANHYPHQLSGGQQQRLALAQTLVKTPSVLLLDEPFGALDPGIRADMHELLRSLRSQFAMTVFMVTHDLSEGFSLADRVITLDKVRQDPQAPHRFGATVTYDIRTHRRAEAQTIRSRLVA